MIEKKAKGIIMHTRWKMNMRYCFSGMSIVQDSYSKRMDGQFIFLAIRVSLKGNIKSLMKFYLVC